MDDMDDDDAIAYCQGFPEILTEWEADFLGSIRNWLDDTSWYAEHALTIRQEETLNKIVIKCRRYETRTGQFS